MVGVKLKRYIATIVAKPGAVQKATLHTVAA